MSEVAESRTEFVSFRVDGGWLADFARTRLEEGAWDRALSLLTDSLDGLTTDQAVAILKGEATLTGDSSDKEGIGYKVLPKTGKLAKKMQDRLDYMYGNIFRRGDELWKPYALVSGWDKEDWHFANSFKGTYRMEGVRDDKYLAGLRSLYYANDPNKDMLLRIAERWVGDQVIADVLCERVKGMPPFWYKVSTNDPKKFIEERLNKRGLPIRGAVFGSKGEITKYSNQDLKPEDITALEAARSIEEKADTIAPPTLLSDKGEDAMNDMAAKDLFAELLATTTSYLVSAPTDYAELREMDRVFEKGVDTLHRHATGDQWEMIDELRKKFSTERERILGDQVRAQADEHGGWLELPLMYKGKPYTKQRTLRVPKNPFLYWSLRYFNFEDHGHAKPHWDFVAGSGHKMMNDDPYHTDWMLGAGVPLDEAYSHEDGSFGEIVRSSSYELKNKLVREYTGHAFTTLTKGDKTYISGEVVFPKPNERVPTGSIAIVPHAGPEYQLAMESANMESLEGYRGCIICETGGKLAHLVVVGREFKCTVLMMPGATKMYRKGDRVSIDLNEGTITNQIF
jgi:hypothetical protein